MVLIPVRNKGEIVGHAKVDDADASLVSPYRWRLHKAYAIRSIYVGNGRLSTATMHRVILGLGAFDGQNEVDHINHDPLDNRRANLRVVSRSANQHNRAGANRNSTSGLRGAYWVATIRKYRAMTKVGGVRHYLGVYETAEQAAAVVQSFRVARGLCVIHAKATT